MGAWLTGVSLPSLPFFFFPLQHSFSFSSSFPYCITQDSTPSLEGQRTPCATSFLPSPLHNFFPVWILATWQFMALCWIFHSPFFSFSKLPLFFFPLSSLCRVRGGSTEVSHSKRGVDETYSLFLPFYGVFCLSLSPR